MGVKVVQFKSIDYKNCYITLKHYEYIYLYTLKYDKICIIILLK